MNWDAIGAIGEILGAGAVVVSLFYLATQIRAQNRESRVAAMHDILTAFRESYTQFNDGDIADIFVRGNQAFESLTAAEKVRLFATLTPLLRVLEEAFVQHRQGRFDGELWDAMTKQYSFLFSAPTCEELWRQRKDHFNKDFVDFVDSLDKHGYVIH